MQYTIENVDEGKTFVADDSISLFHSMLKTHGGPIRHGCAGGGCGACRIQVLEGEYEQFKTMSKAHVSDEEKQQGFVLACCIKPKSDMKVKKAKK